MAEANTKEAESAQALFCAIADYVGLSKVDSVFDLEKFPTYTNFKKHWNDNFSANTIEDIYSKYVDADARLLEVERLLGNNNDWYKSSVLIAKKVLKDINSISKGFSQITKPSVSSIFYVRGDKDIMQTIADLFKRANDNQKLLIRAGAKGITFSNINKWSPADIYFASEEARNRLKRELDPKNEITFASLNTLIATLIEKGVLLPLSLKKQTKSVTIQKVNFSRPQELKHLQKIKFEGLSDWKPIKDISIIGKKGFARNLDIYLSSTKKEKIVMRHDPAGDSGGTFKVDIIVEGMEARSGGLGSGPLISFFTLVDPTFAARFDRILKESTKNFKEQKKFYREQLNKKIMPRDEFDKQVAFLSASLVTNNLMPEIIRWTNNKNNADNFVRICYQYATSRTEDSARFVIAK